jgi:hypothetical protein
MLDETIALTNAFYDLKQKANIPTPNWDALENHISPKKNLIGS